MWSSVDVALCVGCGFGFGGRVYKLCEASKWLSVEKHGPAAVWSKSTSSCRCTRHGSTHCFTHQLEVHWSNPAARLWNSLPSHVTAAPSLCIFCCRLKLHLFFSFSFFFLFLYSYWMPAIYIQLWAASIDGLRPSWQPDIISTFFTYYCICLIWLIKLLLLLSSHFLIPLSDSSLICTVPAQWLVNLDT